MVKMDMTKMDTNTRSFLYGVLSGVASGTAQASRLGGSRIALVALIALITAGAAFAQNSAGGNIYNALNYLCSQMVMLLPVVALALLVMAALVYGVGHIFGSEIKNKAQSWATGMIIGMIISLLIWLLAKPLVTILLGDQADQLPEEFCAPTWGE